MKLLFLVVGCNTYKCIKTALYLWNPTLRSLYTKITLDLFLLVMLKYCTFEGCMQIHKWAMFSF
uniref:Uncharacterized protein n=1 Tax=Anguilla anguilla TaxID=7936 RepID=A0A0E9SAC1_ANGAN